MDRSIPLSASVIIIVIAAYFPLLQKSTCFKGIISLDKGVLRAIHSSISII
ncbi:MAG UNVERIFIED_CONTAM: hypothetical protein LVQ98_04340 [Rickettsiaceae bacterium]|jgi:hypothetical protein